VLRYGNVGHDGCVILPGIRRIPIDRALGRRRGESIRAPTADESDKVKAVEDMVVVNRKRSVKPCEFRSKNA
jgi:hypothetical protein